MSSQDEEKEEEEEKDFVARYSRAITTTRYYYMQRHSDIYTTYVPTSHPAQLYLQIDRESRIFLCIRIQQLATTVSSFYASVQVI